MGYPEGLRGWGLRLRFLIWFSLLEKFWLLGHLSHV
jgi:hypothetical protein